MKLLKICLNTVLLFALITTINPKNLQAGSKAVPAVQWADFSQDGAWCWFSDPRAVYYQGTHKQTFAAWVDSEGNIMVGAFNHLTGKIQKTVIHEKLQRDDHNVPSLLVRNDGRIMAFYSRHTNDDYYLRITEKPEDIGNWQPRQRLTLNDNDKYPAEYGRRYCYSNPYQLSSEKNRIFLFWRGIANKPCLSISDDGGKSWSRGEIVIFPEDTYKDQRPYVKYSSNYQDKIHIAFTNGHPRNEPTNGIYYACYYKGAFHRADGSKITELDSLPFSPENADLVYNAKTTNVRAWVWDVTGDKNGYPVIAYTRHPAEIDHRYHYARWDGKQWLDHEIVAAGKWFPQTAPGKKEPEPHYSGGIALNHHQPSELYVSRPINGIFEIEKWITTDLGRSWQNQAITADSKQSNVRPFVVLHSNQAQKPYLLWMNIRHYPHYSNYNCSIKMNILNQK